MLSQLAPLPVSVATRPFKVVLINPYELGRQPFALAEPAALLKREGFAVACLDLSLQKLDPEILEDASLVALYVGMHTATRIAVAALPRLGLNGLEATRLICQNFPNSDVVILTLHSFPDLPRLAQEAGAKGCVLKGKSSELLIPAVQSVSNHNSFFERLREGPPAC